MGSCVSIRSRLTTPKTQISLDDAIMYLRNTPFNQYLESQNIEEFAKCFLSVKHLPSGCRVDLESDRIYIIAQGEVDLSTAYPDQSKIEGSGYLCKKRPGDIINLKHTKDDARKKASVRSNKINDLIEDIIVTGCGKVEIVLVCADMEELEGFISRHPHLSNVIASITTTQVEDKLLQIPFLCTLPPSKLSVLAAMCRYEAFDSKKIIFEQDDKAEKLYLILNGVAEVVAKEAPVCSGALPMTSQGQSVAERAVALQRSLECNCPRQTLLQSSDVVIADLRSGDYFGETALILNMDRTCKVRTVEKSLFLTVNKVDFKNFLSICPIENTMKSVVKHRLLSRLSSLGIPFLSGITQEMYSSLTDSVALHEVPQHHVIFRQGDVGDKFYIIVHGFVEVTTNAEAEEEDCEEDELMSDSRNESRLGSLGPGQYFGEMALVNADNNIRTANVTSTQKSILLSIDKESFHKIFGSNIQILAEFELRVLKKRARLCHVLKHSLGLSTFRGYLEKEHASENIDFWVAATSFASESSMMTKEKRLARAKQIFLTFCAEYADSQINLPYDLMLELDSNINKKNDVSPEIFDAAVLEIYKLMEKDNFIRFKMSQEFQNYFEKLGIL